MCFRVTFGFASIDVPTHSVNKRRMRLFLFFVVVGIPCLALGAETTNLFTKIASIRALSPEKASDGLPVKVEAVVTYFNEILQGDLVIQDETAGIYIMPLGKLVRARLKPGDINFP